MLGDGIIAPMLPFYAEALGATVIWIGIIFASFSVSRAILMPVAGRLSDRRGRKWFICVGLLAYAVVSLGYVWAHNITQLIAVRLIHGGASGLIIPIAQAYIGDISPEGEEGTWMGYFTAAFFGGFGVGPLMGGLITDHFGMNVAFYTMGGLNMLAFLMAVAFLPEVRRREMPDMPHSSIKEMSASGMVKGLFIFRLSLSLGFGVMLAFLPIFTIEYVGLSSTLAGLLLAVNILLMSLLQLYAGKIADRFSRRLMVIIGSALGLVFLALIPGAHSFWPLLALCVLGGIGGAIALPAAGALMVEAGRRFGMGSTIAVIFVGMSVGIVAGSVLGGIIADSINIGATFYFAALMGLIGTGLFAWFTR